MEPVVSQMIAFPGISYKASGKRAPALVVSCWILIAKVPRDLTLRMRSIFNHRGVEHYVNNSCTVSKQAIV